MSKVFDTQQKLVDLLAADAYFTDPDPTKVVRVLTQRVGDIETEILTGLQTLGVGVIVMLPLITFMENDTPDIELGLKFAIVFTENPLMNATGKPAESLVEKAIKLLHFQPNGIDPGGTEAGRFIVDRNAVRQIGAPPKNRSILSYNLSINTEISI